MDVAKTGMGNAKWKIVNEEWGMGDGVWQNETRN